MKILVTGADGFIGSHLTEKLVLQGHDVRAFVMYNSIGSWGWLERSPKKIKEVLDIFPGDIRDPHGVKEAMSGCDAVLHLAALIAIPFSYHSPHTYIETNVKGTLNVLQAARELGIAKVVHTSTSEVYGTAKSVPISEDHPLQGQSPYSASKIAADQLAFSYYASFDLPILIVRPFNTYGPRQSARAVLPTVMTQIAAGSREIRLGATSPTRDFSFVSDTVAGFIAALGSKVGFGEVINLGSNFEISISDAVNIIAKAMGVEIDIICDEVRIRPGKSEVQRLWADNTKAKSLLNWEPKYHGKDGFERGIAETANWFLNEHNTALYKSDIYNI
jgi:dTDP-glucose 4,6-dehydratase